MKFKKRLVGLMLATALTTFTFALTSCKDEEESSSSTPQSSTESVKFEQTGEYYCGISDGEYTLTITDAGCTLVMGSETLTGTYAYDGKDVSIVFSDGSLATATVKNTVLTFKKGNLTYTFYEKIEHTVKYETNGGTAIADTKIVNGKVLAEPTAPTKEGYWFIGWYTDEDCKKSSLYDFDEQVMGNTKLYARFVQKVTQTEFKVNFVVDGQSAFDEMTTRGGSLYMPELPTPTKEGATFVGWWASSYDDETKLTYKYEEQKLGQNTTLYAVWASDAPSVSVTPNGVSWDAMAGDTYKVVIKNAQGNNIAQTTTPDTSYEFDFSEWAEGDYTVEVSVTGKTDKATAYYKNKALDRVTYFNVTSERELVFNEIENATKYVITVTCGDSGHVHTQVESTTPVFDFADCAMQETGITFTVQAKADGYVDSPAQSYTFEARLAEVTGLNIDESTEIASWNAVENADYYVVEIIDDGVSLGTTQTTATTVSLRGKTGNLEVKVYPVSRYYNSSAVQTDTFVNTRLAVPAQPVLDGHALVWAEVEGATGYKVKVGTEEYTVTTNRLELTDEHFTNNEAVLSVQAICADNTKASLYSDSLTVRSDNKMDANTLAYSKGEISWGAVLGASQYGVRINEGEEKIVKDALKTTIAFAQAGINKVEIRCYNAEGTASDWVVKTVQVYAIEFQAGGGVEVATLYKAEGDLVTLDSTTYQGYDFMGWYASANGYENNGVKYADSFEQGEGNLTLYAGWKSKNYVVELQVGDNGQFATGVEPEVDVLYNKPYSLPVPTSKDEARIFAGWYTEANGQGLQYADMNGSPVSPSNPNGVWTDADNRELYAHWYTILSFKEVGTGANKGYAVSKNDEGIGYVEHLRIPATYKGLTVTTIEGAAFAGCTNLKTISIPDTIENIFISTDDKADTGSAFDGCSSLQKLIMYKVDEASVYDTYYETDEAGALIYKNPVTQKKEFKFLPSTYTGTYQIPDGVEVIPTASFKNARITKIVIPASVTQIDSSAFANCKSLSDLEFLAQVDNKDEKDLTIANGVFKGCTALIDITLPARVVNLNFDIFSDKVQSINITGNAAPTAKTVYYDIDGVLCLGDTLVYMPKGRADAYRIPNGINKIGSDAFASCTKITRVDISAWVEVIEKNAFLGCTQIRFLNFLATEETQNGLIIEDSAFFSCKSLTEVILPANLTSIGQYAFGNTTNLKKVTLNSRESAVYSAGAFADKAGVYAVTNVVIGENVKELDIAAVFGTTYLKTVEVSKDNPYIASYGNALYTADYEKIIFFPASIKSAYTLHENTKIISENVFKGKFLTEITIPAGVHTIAKSAFEACHALTKISWLPATEGDEVALTIGDRAFYNVANLATLEVPARVVSIGISAFANNNFETVMFVDGDLELAIGANAFENSASIKTISLPTRLRTIGEYAFNTAFKNSVSAYESYEGVNLIIPEGVTAIGDYAFKSNVLLKTVSLPSTLVKMGAYTDDTLTSVHIFEGCSSLSAITLENNTAFAVKDGVLYNADYTQLYLSPIKNTGTNGVVDIPKTVTKIWDNAFKLNANIKQVTFSEGIEGTLTFGTDVFRQCTQLTSVELPVGLTEIPTMLFYDCDSLVTVTIPYTVGMIKNRAFEDCKSLLEVVFQPTPASEEPVNLVLEDGAKASSSSNTVNAIFKGCNSLTTVQLPERTTVIGKYALYDLEFEEYTIPSTVTSIGSYAFYNCDKLEKVTFAEGCQVTEIAESTFYSCDVLHTINLPASVTKINANAFENCKALDKVNFAEGLLEIADNAFKGLSVTTMSFPASLKQIGASAFEDCASLMSISFATGSVLESIGNNAFKNCKLLGATVVIPASTQSIGESAFASCSNLKTVTFENTNNKLSNIGKNAFAYTALESFTFPDSSATITLGDSIVADCTLGSIHISASVTDIKGGNVFGAKAIGTITVAKDSESFSIMAGQKILLNKAEDGIKFTWGKLEGVLTFTEGFEYIDANVFKGQTLITALVLPTSLKRIGDSAFEGCTGLQSVDFGKAQGADHMLGTIGAKAFYGCSALESVALPKDLTELGESAFENCGALKSISINARLTTIRKNAFKNTTNSANLEEGEFATIELAYGLTNIGESMFESVTKVNAIVIPTTVANIALKAFYKMTALATVSFDENTEDANVSVLESIGNQAFEQTTSLTAIDLPNSVTTLGTELFVKSGLTRIGLPEGIQTIPAYMFNNCKGFTGEFTIPDSVKAIGNDAFSNCTNITGFVFPASLETIAYNGFYGCSSLEEIVLPENLKTLGNSAFAGCSSVETLKFAPDGKECKLTVIPDGAFADCESITSIVIPKSVKSIGEEEGGSFSGVSALTSLVFESADEGVAPDLVILSSAFDGAMANVTTLDFGNRIKEINEYAFSGNKKLTALEIPASVTKLGGNAFYNWTALTKLTFGGSALKTVESRVFNKCTKLNEVIMREGTTVIASEMFFACTATGFKFKRLDNANSTPVEGLPTTLTSLPANAFATAVSSSKPSTALKITKLDLSNVKSIGKMALMKCTTLTSVTWGTKLETIGESAFEGCTGITGALDLSASAKSIGKNAFKSSKITSVKLGTNFTSSSTGYQFAGCTSLTSATLPNNLTKIDTYMFQGCTALTTVEIPASVTTIATYAFSGCTKLNNLGTNNLSNVTSLGGYAFKDCKAITSIDLSALTDSLGASAFQNCTKLTSVTFNDSLGSIQSNAFNGCTVLTGVTLPANITFLGEKAFSATGLTSIVIPRLLTNFMATTSTSSTSALAGQFYNCKSLENVTFLGDVTKFGKEVFYGCTSLKSIDLPDSVQMIGNSMFYNCSSLTYFEFPADLQEMGTNVFNGCTNLANISISSNNEYFKVVQGGLYAKQDIGSGSSLIPEGFLVMLPLSGIDESTKVLTLPEGCTGIQRDLFKNCDFIEEVIIPSTMTEIGDNAFAYFTGLKKVTIPTTVTYIGMTAFGYCTSLETVIFEDDVNAAELYCYNRCFEGCTAIESVVLPSRMKTIGSSMFSASAKYLTGLKSVTIAEGTEVIEASAFKGTGLTSIQFPSTLKTIDDNAFQGAPLTTLTIPTNVTTIGDSAFATFSSTKTHPMMTSIVIPTTVTSWGTSVFQGCVELTNVTIADGVKTIPSYMFADCTKLTQIDLKEVTSLGSYAFQNTGLTSVVIPEGVENLSAGAGKYSTNWGTFKGCTALTSVTLPTSLKSLGGQVFSGCTALTEIKIVGEEYDAEVGSVLPSSLSEIGPKAFENTAVTKITIQNPDVLLYQAFDTAKKLESVTLPDDMKYLGYKTFYDCEALTSIELPDSLVAFNNPSVTSSGYQFAESGITEIVIPEGIESLPANAFYNCKSLTSVTLPESLKTVDGGSVFYGCKAITSIVIPKGVIFTGTYNFSGWTKTQTIYFYDSESFVSGNYKKYWLGGSATCVYDYVPPVVDEE